MTKFIEQLKSKIVSVAEQNPSGFTFNPKRRELVPKGYVVASSCTQDCFGKEGLFRVIKFYLRHLDYCIGGWRNEDGIMQFDASRVYYTIEDAVLAAIDNRQRAFYNLYTGKEIMACDYGMWVSSHN